MMARSIEHSFAMQPRNPPSVESSIARYAKYPHEIVHHLPAPKVWVIKPHNRGRAKFIQLRKSIPEGALIPGPR